MAIVELLLIFMCVLFLIFIGQFVYLFLEIRKIKKTLRIRDVKDYDVLCKNVEVLNSKFAKSLQKVGLIRFNPFSNNVGGSLSFALAMLNEHNTGVVISSLHNRDFTRLYVKPIYSGKNEKIE